MPAARRPPPAARRPPPAPRRPPPTGRRPLLIWCPLTSSPDACSPAARHPQRAARRAEWVAAQPQTAQAGRQRVEQRLECAARQLVALEVEARQPRAGRERGGERRSAADGVVPEAEGTQRLQRCAPAASPIGPHPGCTTATDAATGRGCTATERARRAGSAVRSPRVSAGQKAVGQGADKAAGAGIHHLGRRRRRCVACRARAHC